MDGTIQVGDATSGTTWTGLGGSKVKAVVVGGEATIIGRSFSNLQLTRLLTPDPSGVNLVA